MIIYQSEQVQPYVYKGTHKITGQVYIGSRSSKKQKLPSHLDLQKYKTSSKVVRPIFHEFDWVIVAEFFEPEDAYKHEQLLISEQWDNSKELSLNLQHRLGKGSWNTIGREPVNKGIKGIIKLSDEVKDKMSKSRSGVKKSKEHRNNIGKARQGKKYSLREPKIITGRPHKGKRGPQLNPFKGIRKSKTEEQILNESINRTKLFDFITPAGFVIEQISIKDICSQFNLNRINAHPKFSANGKYKGFIKL